jgi:hypothetical protein
MYLGDHVAAVHDISIVRVHESITLILKHKNYKKEREKEWAV